MWSCEGELLRFVLTHMSLFVCLFLQTSDSGVLPFSVYPLCVPVVCVSVCAPLNPTQQTLSPTHPQDFVTLQFIPPNTDLQPILPVLAKVFDQVCMRGCLSVIMYIHLHTLLLACATNPHSVLHSIPLLLTLPLLLLFHHSLITHHSLFLTGPGGRWCQEHQLPGAGS